MMLPISRSLFRCRNENLTDSIWPLRPLRLLLTGASLMLNPALAAAQAPTTPASAAPADDGQWTMPAKNYAATRYSALDEINGANVSHLQVSFAFSTGVDHGQEAAPIVANNTMFIVTPYPNQAMEIIRPAGAIGIPGLYVTEDPGAHDQAAKTGSLSLRLGLGWSKSNSFHTGQTPVLRYNRQLMMALLNDRLPIAKIVNAKAISLEEAPEGYAEFDKGIAAKFVLDPHGILAKAA